MAFCPSCGRTGSRRKRGLFGRMLYRAGYRCERCASTWNSPRSLIQAVEAHVSCPQCGNRRLSRMVKFDKVDKVLANPFRMLLGLLRASIYHCTFCRLQFRDFRSLHPERDSRPLG